MAETTARETRAAEPLTMYELVFPGDLNTHGTMFGGKVVALMDKCAGLCVGRWANRTTVTASIDAIQFAAPIYPGQMVEATGRVVYVGRSSCVVKVEVYAHNLQRGDRAFTCEGHFTMVGVDREGCPVPLPLIPLETDEQRTQWEQARLIKESLLERGRQSQRDKRV